MNILDTIVDQRRNRIRAHGHTMGAAVPDARSAPLVSFGATPFLICEVKRRSPSRGDILPGVDAVAQARRYADQGVRSVSVLTEQDNFGGSLEDLARIKAALPGLALLRKDFLLDLEDIDVSWRAGADAVLLIASLLDAGRLSAMHARALSRGMQALVEVHDASDVEKCRRFAPGLVGVNGRDLRTFGVDMLHPVKLRPAIDWKARLVFESGVEGPEGVRIARSAGFDGVLVGEAVMHAPGLIPGLITALEEKQAGFWSRVCGLMSPGRPLVKVCGITREKDAETAVELGADMLGFVMAPSKRRADAGLVRALGKLLVLKVAVVVTGRQAGIPRLDSEVSDLLQEGLIDAVQLHGDELPEECADIAFPYFKALRMKSRDDAGAMAAFRCPRVLADAYSPAATGGTGQRVPSEIIDAIRRERPLWIAGGIGPDNVAEVMRSFAPELIDASSRLEEESGRKDRAKLETFFKEIERHADVQ
jgi:indole-3-glycerol phosphate synthase/phosphoribosylanthranilate isomerase